MSVHLLQDQVCCAQTSCYRGLQSIVKCSHVGLSGAAVSVPWRDPSGVEGGERVLVAFRD